MVTFSWLKLGVWTCLVSLRIATPTSSLSTDQNVPAFTEINGALRSQVNSQTGYEYTDDEDYCELCFHEGLVFCCEMPTDPPTTTPPISDTSYDDEDEDDHEEEDDDGDEEAHEVVHRIVGILIVLALVLALECLLFGLPGDHLVYDGSWDQEDYQPQGVITYGKVKWVLCWRTDGPSWRNGKWVDVDWRFTWQTSQGSTTVGGSKPAQGLQEQRLDEFLSQEPLTSFSSSRRSSGNGGEGGIVVNVDVHKPGDAHDVPSVDGNNNEPNYSIIGNTDSDNSSPSHPVKPNLLSNHNVPQQDQDINHNVPHQDEDINHNVPQQDLDINHNVPQQDLDITGNTDSTAYHSITFSPLHPSLFTTGPQATIPPLSPDQSSLPTPLPDITGKKSLF